MLRGINKQVIFEDDEDCEKYLQCIRDCKAISGFQLYAYCLMGNHVHLLIREMKEPLEQIFKRIGARYVFWYNWKYKRSGHLFQDRFKSEPINDDKQLIAVLRYIYQNPIKAGICEKPEDYRWSSYHLLGATQNMIDENGITEIITVDELRSLAQQPLNEQFLELLPDTRITDREAAEQMKEICGIDSIIEFIEMQPEKQERFLILLRERGCSIRQLARITGVSKARIERILK